MPTRSWTNARALALQGKNTWRCGNMKAWCRLSGRRGALPLRALAGATGQEQPRQQLFREILESVKGAPSYYRRRQAEWTRIARQHLK